ncbi:MAG: hypothetical protein EXQ70_11080 [Solirubrobacterales bacterium]|nr:hypothetical protein [Solirubrobacterales bacterium]
MLSAILAGALIVAASLAAGQAILLACGYRRPSAVAPATGLAALLVLCGITIKLPGHGVTAAIACGILVAAAAWYLAGHREALRPIRAGAFVATLGAAFASAIPFLASGRLGILGQGLVNDDMASHLLFAEWIDTHVGVTPDLIQDGYPLGPHAIVAAVTKVSGADYVQAFAGLTGALAVLLALTAYGALRGVPPWLRAPASILAAFPYLAAAYLAQGAFKEPMLGLTVVAFALALPPLREAWLKPGTADRRVLSLAAVPAGLLAAGTIYNYSFPGLAWLFLAGLAWALLGAFRQRSERGGLLLRERLRGCRPAVGVLVGLPVLAAVPEVLRLASFTGFKAFNPTGPGNNVGFGNLRQPLSPFESLGVWPSSEFRIAAENASAPAYVFYAGALLAVVALVWGIAKALRNRESVLPAALVAGALGYLAAMAAGTPYTQAKALAIAATPVMFVALRGLLGAAPIEGEEPDAEAAERDREPGASGASAGRLERASNRLTSLPAARLLAPTLAFLFILAASFSTLLSLRQAAIGPPGQIEEVMRMRPLLQDEPVIYLGRESFVAWELLGADVFAPILHHYNVDEIDAYYRSTSTRAKFDWDVVPPEILASFPYVITTTAAQQSQAPPSFKPVMRSGDYILWKQEGPFGERRTLLEPIGIGALVDCDRPGDRALTGLDGTATVLSRPPVSGEAWNPSREVKGGGGSSEELLLSPGRWRISLQYASTEPLHVRAPGLDETLKPSLLFRGPQPYFDAGELVVRKRTLVPFKVTVDPAPWFGRLIGTDTRAYLGPIAATPAGPREVIPLSEACGRYVDWYRVAPGTPESALAPIGKPEPRETESG